MRKYFYIFAAVLGALCSEGCKKTSGEVVDGRQNLLNQLNKEAVIYRDLSIQSVAMSRTMKYSILLPAGYSKEESYPVLWLLHGMGDDQNAWLDKGNLAAIYSSFERKGGRKMVIVCPDALTSFYVGDWERYFYEELIPEVEKTFSIDSSPGMRAIAGLSMGGYGTLYHSLSNPSLFCCAYACSPAAGDALKRVADALEDKVDLPYICIESGSEDFVVGSQPQEFHEYLDKTGIKHDWILRSGSHDWKFWQECLPKILDKAEKSFK